MEYLYSVFWKDFKIGYILTKCNKFIYTYNKDGLKQANKDGFDFLIGFPDINEIYVNDTMFPIFQYRIKTKERLKRDNIDNYNDKLNFNNSILVTDYITIIDEKEQTNAKRI